MPKRSLIMRRARFLDKEEVIEKLSKLALKAKSKDPNIKEILLFGSIINNTFTSRSDADILVILRKGHTRFLDRIPKFLLLFANAPVPVDVFPYTEEEVQTVPIARKAMAEGLILA